MSTPHNKSPGSSSNPASSTEAGEEYVNMAFVGDSGDLKVSDVSKSKKSNDNDEVKPECGIKGCKPHWMQVCANLGCFTSCYSMAALLTQTLTVYLTSQITSVEKQFGFTSSQVGVILGGNDIGFLIMVLFVSHFARGSHIPRSLGTSTFLFGLSGLLGGLIYFVDHRQKFLLNPMGHNMSLKASHTRDMQPLVCNITATFEDATNRVEDCSEDHAETQAIQTKIAFAMFMLGMLLQGMTKSPRTSLVTAYIDNNVEDETKTGLYMGIITSMGIFGPSVAFLVGGVISKVPVDLVYRGLSPKDPRWIGAWWMGFLIFGGASVLVSIPLFYFPNSMRVQEEDSVDEKIPEPEEKTEEDTVMNQMKDLPISLLRVIKSPVYDFTLFSICILLFSVAGSVAFTPKYLEHQFTQPSWKTNVLLGGEKVIGASTGTLLGGVFTSKWKLSRQGCLKMKLTISLLATLLDILGFFLGCKRLDINGMTWNDGTNGKHSGINVNHNCEPYCHCPKEFYPVCGSNGQNYLTPCTGGCTIFNETVQAFGSCDCIEHGGTAMPGFCDTDCPFLYPYVGVNLLKSFISTFAIVPGYVILLRSVGDQDKSIAIGLMSFMTSLVGWLPGPIVFGYLLDSTCVWWANKCDVRGECLFYDIKDMRIKMHALTVILRFISGLILVFALIAAYIEERRLKQAGQENIFSEKLTFGDAQVPHTEPEPEITNGGAHHHLRRGSQLSSVLTNPIGSHL